MDIHQPLPEGSIVDLCNLAAATRDTERDATFRRLVIDIDALLMDLRWSIGHALLILRAVPEMEQPLDGAEETFARVGMPNRAWVLLRPLMAGHDQVFYSNLLERRPGGGTVAGWMLHMLVEDSVSRSIGILDRCAHLILSAANAPAPRGRMNFRTGKLEILRDSHQVPIGQSLMDIASGEELKFLLDYRDGLAHTVRPMARVMRTPPADDFALPNGQRVNQRPVQWTATDLVGSAVLGLHLCREALPHVVATCSHYITPRRDT
jgi:hypothetical protein